MAGIRRGVPLNPEATRQAILEASLACLAERGPEGLSISEVARAAGVDRGTAHRHFLNREGLLRATMQFVSDRLLKAVFGGGGSFPAAPGGSGVVMDQNARLLAFAMDNPEICRIWLFEVLSSADPMADPFWQAFEGSYAAFAGTEAAQPAQNPEALAVIMLASVFLWPIWVRAHGRGEAERADLARRFSLECLRLSMHGVLKPDHFPEIAGMLSRELGIAPE